MHRRFLQLKDALKLSKRFVFALFLVVGAVSACSDEVTGGPENFDLRQFLLEQQGISVRPGEQIFYLRQQIKEGDPQAQYELACRIYTGRGTAVDVEAAKRLWTDAARNKIGDAAFCLGILHAKGESAEKDRLQTYKWLLLAKEGDGNFSSLAFRMLDEMNKTADASFRSEAGQLAEDWRGNSHKVR